LELLFEIGTEELPADAVYDAVEQISEIVPRMFELARLDFEEVRIFGTPRRIAFLVKGIKEKAREKKTKKKGPPLSVARNEDGSWSEAAIGFAHSQGIPPDSLIIEEDQKGTYIYAEKIEEGQPAEEIIPDILYELISSIKFKKSMKWNSGDERFSRPVRWLVALLDENVLDVKYAGVRSSAETHGHRFLSDKPVLLVKPCEYEKRLAEAMVMVDWDKRRETVIRRAGEVCKKEGTELRPVFHEEVLDEVVQLVEWPAVLLGRFDERFLTLPRQVLEHAMEEHQRYFPVEDESGNLRPFFIAVHNGDDSQSEIIRRGHERVLSARLADAQFFFREDTKKPLADNIRELENVVYQSELGSMAEKAWRLTRLVEAIGENIGLDAETISRAKRAAELSKCDLVTHMVVEFTALQGVMGRIYAMHSGEDERVAKAIEEQYLPRRMGDSLPATKEGVLLSLAEKIDNLAASFGLGHVPTGSEDPYALRRQVNGLILIAIDHSVQFSLSSLVRFAASLIEQESHGFSWTEDAKANFEAFVKSREKIFFEERGFRYDLVDAVLSIDWDNPCLASMKLMALDEARKAGMLSKLYTAFERCHNLSRGTKPGKVDEEKLIEDAEKTLYLELISARKNLSAAIDENDWAGALKALMPLCEPVDRLFDEVLIMTEDDIIRNNRLALLCEVCTIFSRIADFPYLTWD